MTITDHTAMTLDLTITGMTCLGCSRHVSTALERVDGVRAAHVDYRAGRGQVALAPGVTPTPALTGALVTAVERAGYGAAPLMPDLDDGQGARSSAAVAAASCCASTAASASPEAVALATRCSDTPSFAGEAPTRVVQVDASGRDAETSRSTPASDFDLLILGTGGAGVAAAIQAAGMGATVGIVESETLGGTCVNVGCIPSKMLMEAAAHVHAARRGFPGIAPCEPSVNWREVVRQKDALVEELREAKYADVLASYPGVARLIGHARLLPGADGVLRVRVGDAATGRDHTARKVIVATGASAALPSIPGLDAVDALDSTSAMALDALPASMIVLGGGPVGVELGQMFARFGVRVVLVQRRAQLLPGEDLEIAAVLREALEAEGIEIHTGTSATRVERDGTEVSTLR